MDGSSSAGNPSAASSRSLPAGCADDEGRSPAGTRQTTETRQSPAGTRQSPAGTRQSPAEVRQSPLETHQSPPEARQSPAETHQTSEDPDQLGLTGCSLHKDSTTKNKKTEVPQTEPDRVKLDLLPTEPASFQAGIQTSQKTDPDPDHPKPAHPSSAKSDDVNLDPRPVEQQKLADLSPTNSSSPKHPPKPHELEPDPPRMDQQEPEDRQEHQTQHVILTNHKTEDPPPPHLSSQEVPPPPADQQNHLSSPQVQPPACPPPQAPPLTIEVFCDPDRSGPPASYGGPKLCGFLQKQGGPLRAWKQRWFTYEEKKNQLFYYRTPQDVTPLGRVELCSATFTYPLKGESGTFHIKTPERTFVLKAVTQELMLYWLQQLQVKRWQHRETNTCPDPANNNNTTDDFLPAMKSLQGLVGEEAANAPSQRTPLANMSIKHPFIEIQ